MPLETAVDSLDAIPEPLREFYKEGKGSAGETKFFLDHADRAKLAEFRDNNVRLTTAQKEMADKLKLFDGIDPAKYTELAELERQKRDKELIATGDFEKVIETRLASEREQSRRITDALKTELESTRSELVATKVTDTLKTAAANAGVRPDAMNDLVRLASQEWELRDGTPTLVRNGEVVLSDVDAGSNMTMPEYFKSLLQTKPFFFQSSAGSGGGSQRDARGVKVIPNDPVTKGRYAEQIASGEVVVEGSQ